MRQELSDRALSFPVWGTQAYGFGLYRSRIDER